MGRIKLSSPSTGTVKDPSRLTTEKIKYPAKAHLKSVADSLSIPLKSNFILLRGASAISRGLSDQVLPFEQESNFYYCTGAALPDWILLYDIKKNESTLFVPPQRRGRDLVYLGQLPSVREVLREYDVDHVCLHDDLGGALISSMSGIFYSITDESLITALTRARSVKDNYEVAACRKANDVSCRGHHKVARQIGRYKNERQAEADFRRVCALQGAAEQAYGPIFGVGRNASVLHYGVNNAEFEDAELLLVDAACSWKHYAADVTRTYPVTGRFSVKGKTLYTTVLTMQKEAIEMLRPGVSLSQLDDHVHSILSDFLVQEGLVRCTREVCMEKKLSKAFMMHGIGHHIGLDVHDVTPMTDMSELRHTVKVPRVVAQAPLVAGNIVTVEPGIYFNEEFLSTFYESEEVGKLFDEARCREWYSLGGVRIEDCVLITGSGYDNLTSMAKELEEIEAICSELQS